MKNTTNPNRERMLRSRQMRVRDEVDGLNVQYNTRPDEVAQCQIISGGEIDVSGSLAAESGIFQQVNTLE